MTNIRSIINRHNKEVITQTKTEEINHSCTNFPLSNQHQITNIIYKAKIT